MKPGTTYDYQTRFFPDQIHVSLEDDKKVVGFGWERVWADVTEVGTFVVYRKTVWKKETNPLDRFVFCDEKIA